MSNSQFIPATIRTGGGDVAVAFEAAQVRLLLPGQGAEWEVMVRMHYVGVTLDVLEHMHLRLNGEPTLRQAMHGTEIEDESGCVTGFGFFVSGDGLIESIEPVWVEDAEQSLGELPIQFIESDAPNGSVRRDVGWDSVPTGRDDRHDRDGRDGVPTYAPVFGLGVRAHRVGMIVTTFAGFFGAAYLGVQLFGNFWGAFCAGFGAVLMEELFHRLVPAICPECGHRAACLLSSREYFWEGEHRSATVIRYECRSCGFQLPRRVPTRADVAAAASSAIRVAGFAKGFFTLTGLTMAAIASFLAAQRLAQQDWQSAAIAVGVAAFALVFTFIARRAVTGFADAIRTGTRPFSEPVRRDDDGGEST